jgi:hypothetical protein
MEFANSQEEKVLKKRCTFFRFLKKYPSSVFYIESKYETLKILPNVLGPVHT